eukprot:scaffold5064_cov121-Cylindrotheca_fusiformis.AAC.19
MCKTTSISSSKSGRDNSATKKAISGFDMCKQQIQFGVLFMSGLYGIVYAWNPPVSPGPEFCPESEDTCRRPDLFAYKITAAVVMSYLGPLGVRNWYFSKDVKRMSKQEPEDRLFGFLKAANDQNVANLCYQLWDFFVSMSIPEHRETVFLVHHILAGLTAFCSLEFQMVPYYSVFYGGCSEFSSIFLVWADADQFFPPAEGSVYEAFILFCKGMFALTFFIYRVYGWIRHSFPLWVDVLHVTRTGSAEKHRPGKSGFLYLFLALDVSLGALQLFWAGQILEKIVSMMS